MPDEETAKRPPCEMPVFRAGDEGDARPCGVPARFRIERQPIPGAPEWRNRGWSPEDACAAHAARAMAFLADGDQDVTLAVKVYFNTEGEPVTGDEPGLDFAATDPGSVTVSRDPLVQVLAAADAFVGGEDEAAFRTVSAEAGVQ
jgi:hypothetical protein